MRFRTAAALILTCSASPLGAQATRVGWELTGSVGARFRAESGSTLTGAAFEGGVRSPEIAGSAWRLELALGYTQVTAHGGTTSDRVNVRENSVELSAVLERRWARAGGWRLDGGVGAVLSRSAGCSSGGVEGRPAGPVPCINDFATNGNTLLGARAGVTSEWRARFAGVFTGAALSVHTVASGKATAVSVVGGVRIPLRR